MAKFWLALALLSAAAVSSAQQRPVRIDVQHYGIDAEVNPRMPPFPSNRNR